MISFPQVRSHRLCIEVLLANGANINAADDDGRTALMASAHGDHVDVLELLISRGIHNEKF